MNAIWKKKLNRRFFSIGTSILLYFVLLISLVILLVSILSYSFSIKNSEGLSINYTQNLISEINAGIDSYIDNIKSMSAVVCNNKDVQAVLQLYDSCRGGKLSEDEKQNLQSLREAAAQHMNIVAGTRSEITNIAVISKYHDVLFSDLKKQANPDSQYNLTDWFLKPLSYKDNILVSPPHVQNLVNGEYRWVISVSRAVIDRSTGQVTGVMVIDLNFYAIGEICEKAQLGKNGYTYIIDRDGNLIYHPQQQLIYSGIKVDPLEDILKMDSAVLRTTENKIYTKTTSELTGWTTVGVINGSELIHDRTQMINFYFTLGGISLLLASAAAVLISKSITKPVKQLENTMHRVEDGDLNVQANTQINNEIGHLGKTFNTMIARIGGLMEETVANEQAKRTSEIRALQAQINPHFLYNTLDTIIWLAAGGKNEEVTEVTAALAKLFRTSISRGETYVTLRNEIENIQSYLTIQMFRYGDKLKYTMEVDEKFLDFTVPKLILQPIVENALYHGIKPSPQDGVIRIGALEKDGTLILTVSDNGVGMNEEQLKKMFSVDENSHRGIGVTNVHNRIQLCYGETYGLFYFSVPGTGTRVEIRLPVVRNDEGEGGEKNDA